MDSQFIVVKQTARTTSTCCRLCLLHSSDLQPITDLTVDSHGPNEQVASPLSQLIARYLSIESLIESTITTYICSDCRNTISKWHWFRESCLQNDGVFQKMAQDPRKDDDAGQIDEYYDVEVKQEQELDIFEEDSEENLLTEQLDPSPECVLAKEKEGESTAKKKVGRPRIPESERKLKGLQPCTLCGKLVKNMSGHLNVHNQDRSIQCPHCPLSFSSKNNWDKHVNVHTKEKKYTCSVCDKFFLRSDTLKQHEKSHSEERTYKCPYCPRAYRMRTGLVAHRRTHTEAPNFPCNGCEKKFYTKSQLYKHAVTHLKVKPFVCKICNRGSTTKYGLRMHMEKHHPNREESDEKHPIGAGDSDHE